MYLHTHMVYYSSPVLQEVEGKFNFVEQKTSNACAIFFYYLLCYGSLQRFFCVEHSYLALKSLTFKHLFPVGLCRINRSSPLTVFKNERKMIAKKNSSAQLQMIFFCNTLKFVNTI